MATPHGRVADWKTGACEPVPGVTMPKLIVVERDYGAVADKMAALGPLLDTLGATTKGVTFRLDEELEYLRHKNGIVRGGVADGRPSIARDVQACEAILAMSGTTNGHLATQGFHTLEARTGVALADLAAENEGKQITFADTQLRPTPVITSPEWSGSESGGRRYSPFTINVERLKPWHTLTGRQHFFLDHDWIAELGEGLPVYRPPLNMHALFGEPKVGDQGELGITVRYLTPHNKWSIHSEYQDNLFMLSLSRGGQTIWMSKQDAAKIGVHDNDWIEAVNRNGVVVARAIVSHRMPEGTVYMHHAQDRLIDVPRTETNGRRGGIHNSLTRLLIKPSHLIGGYAQLSYAFNYLGPTGNQRDEVTVIRRRTQEVEVLMRVMAQMSMVMNLDKCIGCHTCSVTCKQAWTNRSGVEYVWFNNVETRPGQGYPRRYEDQEQWRGGWTLNKRGTARAQGRRPAQETPDDLLQPEAAGDRRLLRALDVRLRDADQRAAAGTHPGRPPEVADLRQEHEDHLVGELGRRPRRLTRPRRQGRPAQGHRRQGEARVRADVHVLPATHLRALPQPVVRRVLPVGRDLQAIRGRHRPGRPGPLPRLADVRVRLPVQEGLLQPPHRQGREVHVLLPPHRGRHPHRLRRNLRRPAALHRPHALRRRPRPGSRFHHRRPRPVPGAARRVPRPARPESSSPRPRRPGFPRDWIDAAQRSPVYALINTYQVALPLHPEYRTMPMVWYIPPLSPVVDVIRDTGYDAEDRGNLFAAIDALRIPVDYLAQLFTAGDPDPVNAVLRKLAAMRSYMRDLNLGRDADDTIPAAVGMTGEEIYDMYRLLAIAKYDERYVIPPAHAEQAHSLEELATECSLDYDGGPGMGGSGPFGESSGVPTPIAVENFHMLRDRQTADNVVGPADKASRVNLLNWDGKGRPAGLFPPRRYTPPSSDTPDIDSGTQS